MKILIGPMAMSVAVLTASCLAQDRASSTRSNSMEVPIRLEGVDPIIEVKVNGSPIDVHFDIGTGATLALFPSALRDVQKVQVDTSAGGTSMDGPSEGGRPVYEVQRIEIGGLIIDNARVGEDYHDQAFQKEFSTRLDAHGFLGRGLLEENKLVIDYPQSTLTIVSPVAPANEQAKCRGVELKLVQGTDWGLVSNAATDIGDVVLVWDTGAPANTVLKNRTDIDNLGYEEGDILSLEHFEIDGHDFGPESFQIWDWGDNSPPFDGFVGYDFFAEHVVCIDFPGNRILVQL